jgi:4-amino-4-deoxy-L-arabinose transferase-like glycosyltransferase
MNRKMNRSIASLFLIMLVAFIVRATYNRWDYMGEGAPADYGFEGSQIAASIATGHGFGNPYPLMKTGPTALMPPVYVYLLAGVYKVFGVQTAASYLAATTLSGFFSTLVCIPIFFLGRRVAGDAVALGAASFWAIFPSALAVTTGPVTGVWDTALSTLCAALILAATLRVRESNRGSAWIGYGLLCAFTLQVNPAILSVLVVLFAWLGWQLYEHRRAWVRLPALAGLVIVLGCAPWAVRNWVTFHRFIPFRSNFGLELWLGNNQYADRDMFPDWRSPYHDRIETARLAQLGEIAFMQEKKSEAIQHIKTHPWETLYSSYVRFTVIWTGVTIRVKDVWAYWTWLARTAFVVNFGLVLLGWTGLWVLFRRRSPLAWPFGAYLVIYPIVYYLTHAQLRYRHPVDPALAVLASYAIACAARALARSFARDSAQPAASAAQPQPLSASN